MKLTLKIYLKVSNKLFQNHVKKSKFSPKESKNRRLKLSILTKPTNKTKI